MKIFEAREGFEKFLEEKYTKEGRNFFLKLSLVFAKYSDEKLLEELHDMQRIARELRGRLYKRPQEKEKIIDFVSSFGLTEHFEPLATGTSSIILRCRDYVCKISDGRESTLRHRPYHPAVLQATGIQLEGGICEIMPFVDTSRVSEEQSNRIKKKLEQADIPIEDHHLRQYGRWTDGTIVLFDGGCLKQNNR